MSGDPTDAITALFVPGDRPDRFAKAATSGADIVIIDLEDAVSPPGKASARNATVEALSGPDPMRAMVRINIAGSQEFREDQRQLLRIEDSGLLGVVLPKAETAVEVERFVAALPTSVAVIPLIESAKGLNRAEQIAAVAGVTRLAFGAIDFSLDINCGSDDHFLDYARSLLVVASRAAGIAAPLDSPSTEIRNTPKVSASASLSRGFGFGGKLCIHPGQLQAVASAFHPTEQEIAWARRIVAAGSGAVQLDGHMVDAPVIERAQRILHVAEQEH